MANTPTRKAKPNTAPAESAPQVELPVLVPGTMHITMRELVVASNLELIGGTGALAWLLSLPLSSPNLLVPLFRMADEFDKEIANYQKARKALVQRYGESIGGDQFAFKGDNRVEFEAKVVELDEMTVVLPKTSLNFADLGGAPCSVEFMRALRWLIKLPEVEAEAAPADETP